MHNAKLHNYPETAKGFGYFFHLSSRSEAEGDDVAHAPLGRRGQVVVTQAAHVLHVEELQNVVNAQDQLDVGLLGVHDVRALGEVHELSAALVLLKEGVVLVGQRAPEHPDADVLAQVELLEQGHAVEDLAVEVPAHHERGEAVVEELHVVDAAEGLGQDDVRLVGRRVYEQRIGHLVPLYAALQVEVELAPVGHPEALVDVQLRIVVVVVGTKDAVEAYGVGNAEHWGIEVDDPAAQLVVDVGLARRIAQAARHLGGAQVLAVAPTAELGGRRAVQGAEGHQAAGLVLLHLAYGLRLQAPVGLVLEGHQVVRVEHHLVGLGPLQRHYEVVLVGIHEAVAGRADVARGLHRHGATRKLVGQVLLGVQRVGELQVVVVLAAAPAPAVVAGEEEVLVEVGRGLQAQAAAHAIDVVMAQDGVDGTNVDVVGRAGLHGVLEEGLQAEDDVLHALDVLDVVNELVHGALALRQLHLAVLVPEVVVAHLGVGLGDLRTHAPEELVGQGREGVVRQTRRTADDETPQEADHLQLGGHVVLREHPLAVGQLLVLLQYLHVLDKVDVALVGYGHLAATYVQRGVLQNVEVATETHVVLVVRQEVQVYARVALHLQRVLYVVAVEVDARLGDGRYEGVLQ